MTFAHGACDFVTRVIVTYTGGDVGSHFLVEEEMEKIGPVERYELKSSDQLSVRIHDVLKLFLVANKHLRHATPLTFLTRYMHT
jgi:hypothetical protein